MTTQPIKITVLEGATVFDGPEHIYRYDLPGSGIISGWAISAVVDQIKMIAGDHWPDIEVVVAGEDRATEMLTRTLLNKGIAAYGVEALDDPADEGPPELVRPVKGKNHERRFRPTAFHGIVVAVIGITVGVSWWGLDSESQPKAQSEVVHASTSTSRPVPSASAAPAPASTATTAEKPAPSGVILEYDQVRVRVPHDYQLAPRSDGKLVASGGDPNLRILIAVDPIHDVQPAAVQREVELMVSRDPALSPLTSEKLRGETETTDYHENPGDGSNVRWVTWVEHEHQFSVGCHSRFEMTIPHRAACRMAAESLELKN